MSFRILAPWRFLILICLSCGLVLSGFSGQASVPKATISAHPSEPSFTSLETWALEQNQAAIAQQQEGHWSAAETQLNQAFKQLNALEHPFVQAQLLDTRAMGELQQGNAVAALATWQTAERNYRQAVKFSSMHRAQPIQQSIYAALLGNQINQVQALRSLGFYRRAQTQLERMQQEARDRPDDPLKVKTLQSLGVTLRAVGDLERSRTVLQDAINIAQFLQLSTPELTALELSLAKTVAAQGEIDTASALYEQVQQQESSQLATDDGEQSSKQPIDHPALQSQTQSDAKLQQFKLWNQTNQRSKVQEQAPELQRQLIAQPASRWSIYAQIQLAQILMEIHDAPQTHPQVLQLLEHAIGQAQTLQDGVAESYGLGYLGRRLEHGKQYTEAAEVTRQAIALAQREQAEASLSQWQWQQGRILAAQGQREAAIASYVEAYEGLEALQLDLVAMNPEVQFSFREQVEPVYRQLVALLLEDVDDLPDTQQQNQLQQARQVMESLQLAELQDYFRSACLTYDKQSIEEIDPKAAVIYPILLRDRIEIIASLPNQPLQHYGTELSELSQIQLFETFQTALHPIQLPTKVLRPAQIFYDILVRPLASQLSQQQIKTLVFVSDGFLRGLPMSALHDGQQYLIENYAIALSPGLQLLNAKRLQKETLQRPEQFILAGISEPHQGFLALPAVKTELAGIQALLPSQALINQEFTQQHLSQTLAENHPSILHLATHGQFSSKPEETFLLTWGSQLNVKDIDRLIAPSLRRAQQSFSPTSLELLVLSACETARGDQRAALGMAGIAVRSGARSTIASLWSVFDPSTSLAMTTFYQNLVQPEISRAEALRQAQLALLRNSEYQHPYYWAPFVLIGNWQ